MNQAAVELALEEPTPTELYRILRELGDKGVIDTSLVEQGLTVETVIAVGQLAQAQLCEVDDRGIRITGEGVHFIGEVLDPKK
ncbi:MAG: hypothetical protein Q7S45_04985 [Candidatus Curtissbacteria bacterium]|nr:hypothetical protein [Candidatus Curtissbacteria bacterium]